MIDRLTRTRTALLAATAMLALAACSDSEETATADQAPDQASEQSAAEPASSAEETSASAGEGDQDDASVDTASASNENGDMVETGEDAADDATAEASPSETEETLNELADGASNDGDETSDEATASIQRSSSSTDAATSTNAASSTSAASTQLAQNDAASSSDAERPARTDYAPTAASSAAAPANSDNAASTADNASDGATSAGAATATSGENASSSTTTQRAIADGAADESATTESAAASAEQPADTASADVELPEVQSTVDMETLLSDPAIADIVLGSDDAPVTVVEYASLTCGHCQAFHEEFFDDVKTELIDSGKARFILRPFPLDPRATAAAMIARCSRDDNYYPLVDVLFDRQSTWARAPQGEAAQTLFDTVKIAGFTEENFDACLSNSELLDQVNATRDRAADEFGVDATPTFFIGGNRYAGVMSTEQMAALVEQASEGASEQAAN